jgi:hypothetical protein
LEIWAFTIQNSRSSLTAVNFEKRHILTTNLTNFTQSNFFSSFYNKRFLDYRSMADEPQETNYVNNGETGEVHAEDLEISDNWDETTPTFDGLGLREELLRGIYAYGFERPSAIQQVRNESFLCLQFFNCCCFVDCIDYFREQLSLY